MKIHKTKFNRGSITLEILIAFTVLILCMSAVILISFGNQSVSVDSQTNSEAISKAGKMLEDARALSRQNFLGVISTTSSENAGGLLYNKILGVADLTQCKKQATSTVSWTTGTRTQKVEMTTFFTDITGALALGGDCSVEPPIGGWTNPNTLFSRDLSYKPAFGDNSTVNSSAGNQATGINVLKKNIYMTGGVSAALAKDDFFILDSTNIINGVIPPILGSLNTGPGLNALDVEYDSSTGKTFAFIAQNDNIKQFQVLDVSNTASPATTSLKTLPNITFTCSPASDPCLAAQSIYYYSGKVYIGTKYIANLSLPPTKNNEFHIYCVAPDPSYPACASSSPNNPIWIGSVNVDHNVNAIAVRGSYAYLATSDTVGELTIIDLNNLSTPPLKFDAPGTEDGTSLFLLGNNLYLGRQRASGSDKDFYILDIGHLPTINILGYKNLGLQSGTAVQSINVASKYAFLGLTDSNVGFRVLDISIPANVDTNSPVSSFNFAQSTVGIYYENGFIYTANQSNDALRIIRPSQCADKIDDDGDGKIDSADPQCHTDGNANNPASYNPEDDNES